MSQMIVRNIGPARGFSRGPVQRDPYQRPAARPVDQSPYIRMAKKIRPKKAHVDHLGEVGIDLNYVMGNGESKAILTCPPDKLLPILSVSENPDLHIFLGGVSRGAKQKLKVSITLNEKDRLAELVNAIKDKLAESDSDFNGGVYELYFTCPGVKENFTTIMRSIHRVFDGEVMMEGFREESKGHLMVSLRFKKGENRFRKALLRYALALAERRLIASNGPNVRLNYIVKSKAQGEEKEVERTIKVKSEGDPLTLEQLAEAIFISLRNAFEKHSRPPTDEGRRDALNMLLSPAPDFTTPDGRMDAIRILLGDIGKEAAKMIEADIPLDVIEDMYSENISDAVKDILPFNPSRETILKCLEEIYKDDSSGIGEKGDVKEFRGGHIYALLEKLREDLYLRLADLLKTIYSTGPSNSILVQILNDKVKEAVGKIVREADEVDYPKVGYKWREEDWVNVSKQIYPRQTERHKQYLHSKLSFELSGTGYMRKRELTTFFS